MIQPNDLPRGHIEFRRDGHGHDRVHYDAGNIDLTDKAAVSEAKQMILTELSGTDDPAHTVGVRGPQTVALEGMTGGLPLKECAAAAGLTDAALRYALEHDAHFADAWHRLRELYPGKMTPGGLGGGAAARLLKMYQAREDANA